jgi:hypothetical protein
MTGMENPDFEYDLFLHFCANPANLLLDEAIQSEGLLERVCGQLKVCCPFLNPFLPFG